MRPLPPREARLVALALLVAALTLAWWLVAEPVLDGFASRAATRAQLIDRFHTNEQRIAALPALLKAAEASGAEVRRQVLVASDAGEAGEALRASLEAAAEASGATVKASESTATASTTTLPEATPSTSASSTPGNWAHAALEVQVTRAQLTALLLRLNRLRPALAIDSVAMVASAAQSDYKADQIDVRLEASAPFLPPQPR